MVRTAPSREEALRFMVPYYYMIRNTQDVVTLRKRGMLSSFAALPNKAAGQASRVTIRHAPRTVHTTIQPTMTQMATVVDSVTR